MEVLQDPAAREAILHLTNTQDTESGRFELRQVLFTPQSIQLRLAHTRQSAITPQHVQDWFASLLAATRAAETLPPPSVIEQASRLEETSRHNRNAYFLPSLGITFGILFVFGVCPLLVILGIILVYLR